MPYVVKGKLDGLTPCTLLQRSTLVIPSRFSSSEWVKQWSWYHLNERGHQLKNCFSKTHVCKFQDSLSYGLSGVFFWKNIIYCFLLEKLWQQPRRQGSKGALWYWEHTTTTLVPSVRFLKLPRWNPSDGRTFYRHQRSSQGGKEGKKRKLKSRTDQKRSLKSTWPNLTCRLLSGERKVKFLLPPSLGWWVRWPSDQQQSCAGMWIRWVKVFKIRRVIAPHFTSRFYY